jgi:phosphate:Na+ symporter
MWQASVRSMSAAEVIFLSFHVLGGLALFLFGMHVMSEGLKEAAGDSLRVVLSRLTGRRIPGLLFGGALGMMVHSSAATVMLVGFVHAGLVSLEGAIAPVLGANIGTTLSMQLIAFRLDRYVYAILTAGFLASILPGGRALRGAGRAVLGFGILFLGMSAMSGAIAPHREAFVPILASIDAEHWTGLLGGALLATAVTAIIQSSGATIGISFVLIEAGAFTSLEQVFPIVIGARIGTCVTAMIGSIGTRMEARRTALAHLVFNVLNTLLAIAAAPWLLGFVRWTTDDLIRQTANLHTAIMAVAALLVLPVAPSFAKLIRRMTPFSKRPEPSSFLERKWLDRPEKALDASIRELRRMTGLCDANLTHARSLMQKPSRRLLKVARENERAVNEIKRAQLRYLTDITRHVLSRRQGILLQYLQSCADDVERIGDHVARLCEVSVRRRREDGVHFPNDLYGELLGLQEKAQAVLRRVIESLDPDADDFEDRGRNVLKAHEAYQSQSEDLKSAFMSRMESKDLPPLSGVRFQSYLSAFDRIVRHARNIARTEQSPDFWIKKKKLNRLADGV